jgi:hypothetical protein
MSATATIEPAGACDVFRPTFSELLASEDLALPRAGLPARRWLAIHGESVDASFLLTAWLRYGGEHELLAGSVRRWLDVHGAAPSARFVLRAWLSCGGEPAVIRDGLERWMDVHRDTRAAWHLRRESAAVASATRRQGRSAR